MKMKMIGQKVMKKRKVCMSKKRITRFPEMKEVFLLLRAFLSSIQIQNLKSFCGIRSFLLTFSLRPHHNGPPSGSSQSNSKGLIRSLYIISKVTTFKMWRASKPHILGKYSKKRRSSLPFQTCKIISSYSKYLGFNLKSMSFS